MSIGNRVFVYDLTRGLWPIANRASRRGLGPPGVLLVLGFVAGSSMLGQGCDQGPRKPYPVCRKCGQTAGAGGAESKPSEAARVSGPGMEAGPEGPSARAAEGLVLIPMPTVSFRPMTAAQASLLVALSLKCVGREYPNKPSDVQSGDNDVVPPRRLHPAFFGCFDWHSAVHGHWALVRVLKRFPKLPEAGRIRAALSASLTPERIRGEVAYFASGDRRLFERPYGWGWLLRLAAELRAFDDPDAKRWAAALGPLERRMAELILAYLPRLSLPVRAGTHNSTAFALAHVRDYARIAGNPSLVQAVDAAARRFYLGDRRCPTDYEPSGEDFVSPCLAEADLMRRVLPPAEFGPWLDGFLPPLSSRRFRSLLKPPEVRDPKDAKLGHLIGLMFHRAWTLHGIAGALPRGDARRMTLGQLSVIHEYEGLRLIFTSGYGGAHWLASFALFSLTDAGD